MQHRTIGGRAVSAIGLGGMPMSIEGRPDRDRSIATIHAALDAGVTLIDTADAYHLHADEVGHNEELIAEALRTYGGDTSDVLVATKGGHLRPGDGSWTKDGRPEYLKEAVKASAKRLGIEAIGLYQFHRPDPNVPYGDSVGAIRDLLDDGVIEMAGISNADPGQIRQAQDILGGRLVSVQNQFSPRFRSSLPELDLCTELGIAFLPWSPLGGISQPLGELGTEYSAFLEVAAATASPRSRWRWPGSWRWRTSSCRSPGRRGPRASPTPPRRRSSSSPPTRSRGSPPPRTSPDSDPPQEKIPVKTFTLPGTDLTVPNVVLGLMRIQEKTDEEVRNLVKTASDAGISFFDHADVYGSALHGCEQRFAEAMQLTSSERRLGPDRGRGTHRMDCLVQAHSQSEAGCHRSTLGPNWRVCGKLSHTRSWSC